MTKKTKIVATIGPATESEEVLEQMVMAGMNIARFNTKHNQPTWHSQVMGRVKKVSEKLNMPVGTLLDLQGPEIRINLPREENFVVKKDESLIITSASDFAAEHFVVVPQDVIAALSEGDQVLFEDGSCEFSVVEKSGNYLKAIAKIECTVKHRKTMNTPGVVLNMPALTERDYEYLTGVDPELIDYVGLSFVRSSQDIEVLRAEMKKNGLTAAIVAKIENQAALDNLEDIIAASDAVMVARGDLGVEVPFEELIVWQKKIITLCRDYAKPVITATQMLKSMVENPRPTRAEVSDVANAIFDGTDAVMLSEETTVGKYPIKAVQTQATIAAFNEPHTVFAKPTNSHLETNTSLGISYAAIGLLEDSNFDVDKIVVLTETGYIARLVSRLRPSIPVHAVSSNERTMRQLALLYGVIPHMVSLPHEKIGDIDVLLEKFEKGGIVAKGERVLVIHGVYWRQPGLTNTLTLITID